VAPITVLLTGAGGSAAANVLDALRLADGRYRVVGGDADPVRLHLSTADERVVLPPARDAGYLDRIRAVVAATGADVLHVQPDPEVLAVARARDQIGAHVFLPPQPVLETAADKVASAACLAAHRVPVPDAVDFADGVEPACAALLARHDRIWVRARRGAGSRAALPVRTVDQAVAWVAWWSEERGVPAADFMASEFLPGREFAYQSVWQDGRLVVGQARERVEYLYGFLSPSGQSSTPAVARTVADPRVDRTALAAVTALDPHPHGVYCVDMKEGADGRPKVTEINAGRFFTTSNFFAHAGLNMPDLAVRGALGETLPTLGSSPLPADLYWIRMVDMGFRLVPGDRLGSFPELAGHAAAADLAAAR
jgi:carbamoyl-phosphate synthase large subunit